MVWVRIPYTIGMGILWEQLTQNDTGASTIIPAFPFVISRPLIVVCGPRKVVGYEVH